MKIGAPRKGSEQAPRVFALWQEQVIRNLRRLKIDSLCVATVTIDFGSIGAQGQSTSAQTITGALAGAAVFVSTAGAPTAGVVVDGYVSATDEVTVRASNLTGGAIDPASASYVIVALNPEA